MDNPMKKIHWDGTVNIPTILALLTAVACGLLFIVTGYNALDRRITRSEYDIATLHLNDTTRANQINDMQKDTKDGLKDINTKLDKLVWDRVDKSGQHQ